MDPDAIKTLIELANDSVTALFALMDGVDYAQAHGPEIWAVVRVVAFLSIFLVSNYLIRLAWREDQKRKALVNGTDKKARNIYFTPGIARRCPDEQRQ